LRGSSDVVKRCVGLELRRASADKSERKQRASADKSERRQERWSAGVPRVPPAVRWRLAGLRRTCDDLQVRLHRDLRM
jgi:hypothetical protein